MEVKLYKCFCRFEECEEPFDLNVFDEKYNRKVKCPKCGKLQIPKFSDDWTAKQGMEHIWDLIKPNCHPKDYFSIYKEVCELLKDGNTLEKLYENRNFR